MRPIIESLFYHDNLKCCVLFQPFGFRCGYVGVPEDHHLYGESYQNEKYYSIDIHGGITFSGGTNRYPTNQITPLWWFGFDCHHLHDGIDFYTLKEVFPQNHYERVLDLESRFGMLQGEAARSKEYVEEACRHLAEQLNKLANE